MQVHGDEKQLQHNPPFAYSILNYEYPAGSQAETTWTGLGNGTLMKFKKKKLELEEVYSDMHTNQISGMIYDKERNLVVTASNDLTICWH